MKDKLNFTNALMLTILVILPFTQLKAQPKIRLEQPAIYYGFTLGTGFDNEKYSLRMVLLNIPFDLGVKKNRFIQTQLIIEPQYNRVQTAGSRKWSNFEYGLNTGFRFLHKTRLLDAYFQLSTGPHYISADFRNGESNLMQRGSFIFSNNFVWGFRKRVGVINIHSEIRLRHISNANLKQPNSGINNIIELTI